MTPPRRPAGLVVMAKAIRDSRQQHGLIDAQAGQHAVEVVPAQSQRHQHRQVVLGNVATAGQVRSS